MDEEKENEKKNGKVIKGTRGEREKKDMISWNKRKKGKEKMEEC